MYTYIYINKTDRLSYPFASRASAAAPAASSVLTQRTQPAAAAACNGTARIKSLLRY